MAHSKRLRKTLSAWTPIHDTTLNQSVSHDNMHTYARDYNYSCALSYSHIATVAR